MTRIGFLPFCSQQDKLANKFRLRSDTGVKMYAAMVRALPNAVLFLPPASQCVDYVHCDHVYYTPEVPLSNLERKLHWDTAWIKRLGGLVDVLVTGHEFLPIPLRSLAPKLKVVVDGVVPTAWHEVDELYAMAHKAADAVHCNSQQIAERVDAKRVFVWTFGYEDSYARLRGAQVRDVDVLFNARASETNYTHHREFIAAMRGSGLRIAMTDPTQYLRVSREAPTDWLLPKLYEAEYKAALARSKVVVSLCDNGYGGYAFYEAAAAGCCPVVLHTAAYLAVVGRDWPYTVGAHPDMIREAVVRALAAGAPSIKFEDSLLGDVSYSQTVKRAIKDLESLC